AVVHHLEEAGPGRVDDHLCTAARMDARSPRLQRRDQRRMPRKHADLADLPRHDDHLDLPLVRGAVGRHERDVELLAGTGQAGPYAAASWRPRSTAASIVPTM